MNHTAIKDTASMEELCRLVAAYPSEEAFVQAAVAEFHQNEAKYRAIGLEYEFKGVSTIKKFCFCHWSIFRYPVKIYHLLRHKQRSDAYYSRDGGHGPYSVTKLVDCANFMTALQRFAGEFYCNQAYYLELSHELGDEKSRTVLFHVVKARLTLNFEDYIEVRDPTEDQYFDSDLISFQDEVFCDVGAYIGDTAQILMEKTCGGGSIRRLYLYEPNPKNCQTARAAAERCANGHTEIVVRECGVSNVDGEAFIDSGDSSSQVNASGKGEKIQLVTLDRDIQEPVTFIKMDIEGLEMQALEGCREHIVHDRPKLAICIYHKTEDIRVISQWIKQQVPDYHFYIRHYNWDNRETVLYCLP